MILQTTCFKSLPSLSSPHHDHKKMSIFLNVQSVNSSEAGSVHFKEREGAQKDRQYQSYYTYCRDFFNTFFCFIPGQLAIDFNSFRFISPTNRTIVITSSYISSMMMMREILHALCSYLLQTLYSYILFISVSLLFRSMQDFNCWS